MGHVHLLERRKIQNSLHGLPGEASIVIKETQSQSAQRCPA